MSDLSRQKHLDVALEGEDGLSAEHTVGQALEHYLQRTGIPDHGLRWAAFSRGVRLDNKRPLSDVPDADTAWTVMPEVSAGSEASR